MSPFPLPLVDGDTLMMDNSTLEKLTTCPRNAEYSVIQKLRGNTERVALRFGGIAHKCLETRYRAASAMYAQTPEVESVMVSVAEREFSAWTPPEDDFRNLDRMVDLIKNYGITYPFEDFEIIKTPDGKPAIEVPFAFPLGTVGGIKIVWIGKMDLIYTLNNGLYLMDHKTASMATNMDEFLISHQFYGYAWAAEQLFSRLVTGIMVNRMVCRKPTKTGIPFTFERKYIPVSRFLLDEWKTDCLHIIADFIEMARRGYFPKHTMWCTGKFGTCEFHKVCTLDSNAQRDVLLQSGEYTKNTWTPLAESV